MKRNQDIKKEFNNPSLLRRIEFIDSYDFQGDEKNNAYFNSVIKEFTLTNNNWYNVEMIELAETLNVIDEKLLNRFLSYLDSKNNYILKLAILDYLASTHKLYDNKLIIESLKKLTKKKNERLIVRNQTLLLLSLIDQTNKEEFLDNFKNSFKNTKDYRSHIRTYNFIQDYGKDLNLSNKYIQDLLNISKKKNLGRAVSEKIKELSIELGTNN